ncbi:hypothetical protein [Pseudomonas sp. YuFO8]|uniref:hypothetical protein n=1 Tax=Pseudomonas sp. YuFO8 TaxID=3095361 RepID=UPI002B25275F|nr:hypothetical protein [Pseudomonas sp. YuFO8]MEB2623784.1 hypothetical protein [Pseudomonas sp. YuFO8]
MLPLVVSGVSGSGISTAISLAVANFTTQRVNVVKLTRSDFSLHSPFEMLLHHYGFRPNEGYLNRTLVSPVPQTIQTLVGMAAPTVIIVEDYLNGVVSLRAKRAHLYQWGSLAAHSPELSVVLGTSEEAPHLNCHSGQPAWPEYLIHNWSDKISLNGYLDMLSMIASSNLYLSLDLSRHTETLYALSNGITGNLIRIIQQWCINLILKDEPSLEPNLVNRSLRSIIQENGELLYASNYGR